jgi:tight adherence protein C
MDLQLASVLLLTAFSGAAAVWLTARYLSAEAREAARLHRLMRRVGFRTGPEPIALDDRQSALYSLGLALGPRQPKELERVRTRLGMAGFRHERHLALYFLIKTVGGVAGLVLSGLAWLFGLLPPLVAICVPMALYFAPDLLVRLAAAKRLGCVSHGLPEFVDMCNVCIRAGMGWLAAVQRVAEEMARVHPCLSREFGYTMGQITAGLPRAEALRQLAERNPTREMRHLVQVLIQNERQGSPVAESLRLFTDRVYKEREQYMEEKAGKVSAKMALVIAPFMLLPFVVLLVGEQVVNLIRSL